MNPPIIKDSYFLSGKYNYYLQYSQNYNNEDNFIKKAKTFTVKHCCMPMVNQVVQ